MAKAVRKDLKMTFNSSMSLCWNGGCDYLAFKKKSDQLIAAVVTYAFDKRRFNSYGKDSKSNVKYSGIDEGDSFEKIYGTVHKRFLLSRSTY